MKLEKKYLIDSGEMVEENEIKIQPFSTFFQYGYGVFETMLFKEKGEKIFLLEEHLARLKQACQVFNIPFPALEPAAVVKLVLLLQKQQNEALERGLVKLMVVQEKPARYFLMLRPLTKFEGVRLYDTNYITVCESTRYKTLNYMETIFQQKQLRLRAKEKAGQQLEVDILKKSSAEAILEAGRANLIVYREKTFFFISPKSILINGLTQQELIKKLEEENGLLAGEKIEFKNSFSRSELLYAEEVVYLNAAGAKRVVSLNEWALKRGGLSERVNQRLGINGEG